MMDPPEMHKLKTHSEQEVAYKPIIYKKNVSAKTPKWSGQRCNSLLGKTFPGSQIYN